MIRNFSEDDIKSILAVYQRSFREYPWFEDLTNDELKERWRVGRSKPGFECFIYEVSGTVAGVIWWDVITLERLLSERGNRLANFVKLNYSESILIWEREVMVHPSFQGRGVATKLREFLVERMRKNLNKTLILTRAREDNFGMIKISKKMSFQQTGIKKASSQKEGVFHEYWYLNV